MKKSQGLFIVLEGLDGAGTTTQLKALGNYFADNRLHVWLTHEPTDEPVGKLIRDALSGRLVSPLSGEKVRFAEEALCLLFAADRLEHSRAIQQARLSGTHVVCDRYIHSSIAYQTLDPAVKPERVIEVNRGCAVPDLTFFLKVSPKQCLERLAIRKETPTVYENKSFLEKIARNYRRTRDVYEKHFGPVVEIDGSASAQSVHAAMVERLATLLR